MAISVRLESGGPGGNYWYAAWQDTLGRKRTRSIGSKAKYGIRQAKKRCAEVQAELVQKGGVAGGKCPVLSVWKQRFVAQRDLKKPTIIEYDGTTRILIEQFGDIRLDKISREHAATFRIALKSRTSNPNTQKKNAPKISESTVRKHIRNCKALFREAKRQDLIPINPFDEQVGSPLRIDHEWRQITDEEAQKLLSACPSAKWRALIALTRYAGLRLNEALSLTWGKIDHDARVLIVRNIERKRTTKDAERLVPISKTLYEVLLERFEEADAGTSLVVGFKRGFFQGGGGPRSGRSVISDIYAKAKIPKGDPFHDLRRSLETDWLEQYPAMDVCKMLGHDPAVAQRHYHKVSQQTVKLITGAAQDEKDRRIEDLEREIERLNRLLAETQGTQP